jgi:short-subunit dehydrogenase
MTSRSVDFKQQYGPWALIAGASEGIGLAFADQLAAQGINLVLLSRSQGKLEAAASDIKAKHHVDIRLVAADLTADDCMDSIRSETAGLEIGLLIYNAGAVHGAELFLDDPLEKSLGLVNLNCRGPVLLAHHFGQPMRERKRGGMIFLSSMAAFAGGSYVATYSATKAFDIIFPQSLWHEMAPDNVNVLCLIAGATRTPAMASSGLDLSAEQEGGPAIMDSADVANEGLANLANGPVWIAGEANRATAEMLAAVPRNDLVEAMSMATANLYDKPYIPVKS